MKNPTGRNPVVREDIKCHMRWRTSLSVLAVALSIAVLTPGTAEAAAPGWKIVKGASLHPSSFLYEVDASGPRNVWAVGYENSGEKEEGLPVVERWDGSRWRQFKISGPDAVSGVSVVSATNVWLAGHGGVSWVAHWNGSRLRTFKPFGANFTPSLRDIAAAGGTAWIAADNDNEQTMIVRGSTSGKFTTMFRTRGELTAIAVRSGEVWAVGRTDKQRPLVVRGVGNSWRVIPTPAIPGGRLTRVLPVAKNKVWAVGYTIPENLWYRSPEGLAASRPISLFYDGKAWRQVPVPVAKGMLTGLTVDSSGTVWASGVNPARGRQVLFLQYTGRKWVPSYGPTLAIPPQEEAPRSVLWTSITRVPGSRTLWTVASAGGGDKGKEFILRRG